MILDFFKQNKYNIFLHSFEIGAIILTKQSDDSVGFCI